MKEKDGSISDDALTQLNNSRTPASVLKVLYSKVNCTSLSNVQRNRLLKNIIQHINKEKYSSDVRVAALTTGLTAFKADISASCSVLSGSFLHLLEACVKILESYNETPSSHHNDEISRALEILSLINISTASKLLSERSVLFKKIIFECLKQETLHLYSLTLLDKCWNVSKTGDFANAMLEDQNRLIELIYPLLFNVEDAKVSDAALNALRKLDPTSKTQPFWNQLKDNTQKIYCRKLSEMVNRKLNWPEIWQFVVNMFGEELHSGGQLINHMLEVLERAFKHSDFEWTRVQAFHCWNTLINNFKSGLKNRKRIELIMIPLRANNHRIESLASAKFDTYMHLLRAIGKDLPPTPDLIQSFLSFCLGAEKITCPAVKSYPLLQEKCVKGINELLLLPFMGSHVFVKYHKELINAVGDCFVMGSVPPNLLITVWSRLLELVSQEVGTDIWKAVLNMVNTLVQQAQSGTLNGTWGSNRLMSPLASSSAVGKPQEELAKKIVSIIIYSMVQGKYAVPNCHWCSRSLYIGSDDVMNGTLTLLFVEWLLTCTWMLGAGDINKQLISKIVSCHREDTNSFMDFCSAVLRKLYSFFDNIPYKKKMLIYKNATDIWCLLVDELVKYCLNQGELNQGNAAEPDFTSLYSVLMFPIQHLHTDFDCVKKCGVSWCNLFYEACQAAELHVSMSAGKLCEQICLRLVSVSEKYPSSTQHASVFFSLTCILQASKKLKSTKTCRWMQQHISSILKDFKNQFLNEELVFELVTACAQSCLQPKSVTREVVANLSAPICCLLEARINAYDPGDKLCTLLDSFKQALQVLHHHGLPKDAINTILQDIVTAGGKHASQKVISTTKDLSNITESKTTPEKEAKSPSVVSTASSPVNRVGNSPKPHSKKFLMIQMSPSNLSPGGTKRKLQATVCGSDGKFVRIETPPKKIILTEHQKEVRRERRQDIPALYQDLSQDTQSISQDMSQDCVPLPMTPNRKLDVPVNEDAVMDKVDVSPSVQIKLVQNESPKQIQLKMQSPKSVKKDQAPMKFDHETRSFTPPAGFVLPNAVDTCISNAESRVDQTSDVHQDDHRGKENEDVGSPLKADRADRTSHRGALTRSSSSTNFTTRSGKVVKRNSLAAEPESKVKRKYSRKSLPVNSLDELTKKMNMETTVLESDTTDTESISSVTSDTSGGVRNGKAPKSKTRRSIVKDLSQDYDAEAEKSSQNGIKNSTVTSEAHTTIKEKDFEMRSLTDSNESKDALMQPSLKAIGGKVITRSRSNSSLDEVIGSNKKLKDCISPSRQVGLLSFITEQTPVVVQSLEKCSPESIRINGSSQTNGEMEEQNSDCHTNLTEEMAAKAGGIKRRGRSKVLVSPKDQPNSDSIPQQTVPTSHSDKTETEDGNVCKHIVSKCNEKEDASVCPESSSIIIDSDESQEIIESSQEHFKVKPCSVNLKQIRLVNSSEKTEIEDVIVTKGPDAGSPFKIYPKDQVTVAPIMGSLVRRSLVLEEDIKPEVESSLKSSEKQDFKENSASCEEQKNVSLSGDEIVLDGSLKSTKNSVGDQDVTLVLAKVEEKKVQDSTVHEEVVPVTRNDSLPDWMHEKKSSPSSKTSRMIRGASARSQAFMKHLPDVDFSSSPPKNIDVSPISSPVQLKRMPKTLDSNINTTPIIKRSSRAAQLLGLGQAAAVRGGHTVVSSASRPARFEKMGESVEEGEGTSGNVGSALLYSTAASTQNASSPSTSSSSNTLMSTISLPAPAMVASPSIRRQGRLLEFDSTKSTPQKCLEDGGLKEDWIPKDPLAKATPDSSILKRKRESDSDAPSPSLKRKRVSFRDPPLSSMLRFGETTEAPGTVFCSDRLSNSERATETPTVERDQDFCIRRNGERLEKEPDHPTDQSSDPMSIEGSAPPQDTSPPHPPPQMFSSPPKNNTNMVEEGLKDTTPSFDENCCDKGSGKEGQEHKFGSRNELIGCSERNQSTGNGCNDEGKDQEDLNSEDVEVETQGMLDDLHRVPSLLTPIYANLVKCIHSVECISSKLTSSVWKKALMREFTERKVFTVGHLASLTEDQLDRFSVKPPKRTNVCCVLEDFERRHSNLKDGIECDIPKDSTSVKEIYNLSDAVRTVSVDTKGRLKDVLTSASDEDIMKMLAELGRDSTFFSSMTKHLQPQDVAASVALNQQVLKSLPLDVVADLYISQASVSSGKREKTMSVHELVSILERIPGSVIQDTLIPPPSQANVFSLVYSDLMQDYVFRECNPSDVIAKLSESKVSELFKILLQKHSSSDIAKYLNTTKLSQLLEPVLQNCPPLDIVQFLDNSKLQDLLKLVLQKHTTSEIVHNFDVAKLRQLLEPVLLECGMSDVVKILDETQAQNLLETLVTKMSEEQLVTTVIPKMTQEVLARTVLPMFSPSDIAQELDDSKAAEVIKALLCKFNLRRSLSFLFDCGQAILKKDEMDK